MEAGHDFGPAGTGVVERSYTVNTKQTMEQIMRHAAPFVCDPPMLVIDRITQSLRAVSLEEIEDILDFHQRSASLDQ